MANIVKEITRRLPGLSKQSTSASKAAAQGKPKNL